MVLQILKGNDHALIGSLLGYGDANSKLFQEGCEVSFPLKQTRRSPDLKISFGSNPLDLVYMPSFVVDHNLPETKVVLNRYLLNEKAVAKLAKSPNFLDEVLKIYISGNDE